MDSTHKDLCFDFLWSSCKSTVCCLNHSIIEQHLNKNSMNIFNDILWIQSNHCKQFMCNGACTLNGCTNAHIVKRCHLSEIEQQRLDSIIKSESEKKDDTLCAIKPPKLTHTTAHDLEEYSPTPPASPLHGTYFTPNKTEGTGDVIFNTYKLVRKIGVGSHATVWQGHYIEDGKAVALKKTKFKKNGQLLKRTYREVKLLQHFTEHPNTVTIYDLVTNETQETFKSVFIVMDYCDTDLKKFLNHTSLSIDLIRDFTFQLVCAIRALHRANVIHRDLKPQNILIVSDDKRYQLKLCDFGTGRTEVIEFHDLRRTTLRDVTTLYYCAPEGILKKDIYSNSVDMWALGCIVGEMVTRYPLLPGDGSWQDQLRLIVGICGRPKEEEVIDFPDSPEKIYLLNHQGGLALSLGELLPKIDPKLLEFLKKLLVFNPQKRLTAKDALKESFLSPLNVTKHVTFKREYIEMEETIRDEKWKELLWDQVVHYRKKRKIDNVDNILPKL